MICRVTKKQLQPESAGVFRVFSRGVISQPGGVGARGICRAPKKQLQAESSREFPGSPADAVKVLFQDCCVYYAPPAQP